MTAQSVDLDARWGRAGSIVFEQRYGGTVAVLSAAGGTAVVALQGAQVLSWVPAGQVEVLWLSPVARLGSDKAVRGGIPICWPWFGPHPGDAAKPAHGFVRTALWNVAGSAAAPGRARIVLAFDATRMDPQIWPHTARVEAEITLTDKLTVSLTTANHGAAPFALTEALHTYLALGDVAECSVSGLADRAYIDQLQPAARLVETGPIAITGEIDRIYQDTPDDVIIDDRGRRRCIRIAKSGSRSTVVWNPWVEKAARLGDMATPDGGPDGYRHMVCVETANAGDDVVTLAPGARHRLVTEVSIVSSDPA